MGSMTDLPVPRRRAGAVLSYALNRWETQGLILLVCAGIAATIAFLGGNLIVVLGLVGFGLLGVGLMVVVSFRDATSVDEALTEVDLGAIHDRGLREKVARAQAYQRAIRQTVRQVRSETLRSSLDVITREMAEPIELVYTLAKRLEGYRSDGLLHQDRQRLLAAGGRLSEPEQQQLATLAKLDRLMADTASAIDGALAQMGASYSAVQLARTSGELKGAQTSDVLGDLRSQAAQLRDLDASLDEVYGERLGGGTTRGV
jgi:hypothetical protein